MSKLEIFKFMADNGKETYTMNEIIHGVTTSEQTTLFSITRLIKDRVVIQVQRARLSRPRILKLRLCEDCSNPHLNMIRMVLLEKIICENCFIELKKRKGKRVRLNPKVVIY